MISKNHLSASLVGAALMAGSSLLATPALATEASQCLDAGATGLTGLTAAVVARSGATYRGDIPTAGCDIGIYIGPGVTGVTVDRATIAGAGDHGILVQDTSDVTIIHSTVSGSRGAHSDDLKLGTISEDKAIELVGTTGVTVTGNTVIGNATGGIGISDDGAVPAGTLKPGEHLAATGNVIVGNVVTSPGAGCGIVVAAYNPDTAGVVGNVVAHNTVSEGPAGIVVAADVPGTAAVGNKVVSNTSTNNALPGIIVHANTPGDVVSGTVITGNTLSGNGFGGPLDWMHSGIALVGEFAQGGFTDHVTGSVVTGNRISDEPYGISEINTLDGVTRGNKFGPTVGTPLNTTY